VTPVLQLTGIHKRYQGLRPLRLQELTIAAGERVAVSGFDAGAAEVLVNLVTGASLPDQGEVRVLGHLTADIAGGDEWLASLDRFGIVSPRGVLLEGATVEQNLAMPMTLQIDPVPPDVAARVAALARECGIEGTAGAGNEQTHWLQHVTGEAPPHIRARMHRARTFRPTRAQRSRTALLRWPTRARSPRWSSRPTTSLRNGQRTGRSAWSRRPVRSSQSNAGGSGEPTAIS